MPRSVNSVAKRARRKKVLKQAKGYFGRRKNVWTVAKNAVEKALVYAYRDRRQNKRNFRSLWIMRINAGARLEGMSYSQFIGKVKANGIELNRKVLADLAMNHPEAFKAILNKCSKSLSTNGKVAEVVFPYFSIFISTLESSRFILFAVASMIRLLA
jgi:large subunit ribosomal protein L20